jgi:hypothetical protein
LQSPTSIVRLSVMLRRAKGNTVVDSEFTAYS